MVSIGEQPSNQTESKVPTSDHKQNAANISGKNEKKNSFDPSYTKKKIALALSSHLRTLADSPFLARSVLAINTNPTMPKMISKIACVCVRVLSR